jgi:CBS-domain-containing membrane protein
MTSGHFRHLPVVDDDGNLTGMVSQRDFVAITWEQLFGQFKNKTKSSFLTFSSVWMLCIGMVLYAALILLIFTWVIK